MPQISILVPHQGHDEPFERTLASVLQNLPANAEVIATHAGYEDPYDLADEVQFIELPRRSTIKTALQATIDQADSNVIHVLTDGVEVTDGWTDWAVAHFQDPYVGSVVPLLVEPHDHEQIIHAGLNQGVCYRGRTIGGSVRNPQKLRLLEPIGPTSNAAFYRTSALQQIPELDRLGASTIDLDIALVLSELGFESKLEIDSRVTWDQETAKPISAFATGRDMQRSIWNFAGMDGPIKSLLATGGAMTLELATAPMRPANLLQLAGRVVALLDAGRFGGFHTLLNEAPGPQPGSDISRRVLRLPKNGSDGQATHRRAA